MSSKYELFDSNAKELELQELEGNITGPALADIYGQLLSIYLCNFDLCNAKFLWKRISSNEKAAFPILGQIWEVGKRLWLKEHNAVFNLISTTSWPPTIEPYMSCLEETYREQMIHLIAKSYISITSTHFAELVGFADRPDAAEILLSRLQNEYGWTSDTASKLIMPKRPSPPKVTLMKNEDQLASLTQFVSFLEN